MTFDLNRQKLLVTGDAVGMKIALISLSSVVAAIILLFSTIVGAQAAVLYTAPLNNSTAVFFSSGTDQIADPFVLASGGTIESASWYGFASSGSFGPFSVIFYGNDSGHPSQSPIEDNAGITPTISDTGTMNGASHVYQFTYDLALPITLLPGVQYFFSVLELSSDANFLWSGDGRLPGGMYTQDGGTNWFGGLPNQAFSLSGSATPLPTALPLFATGLGGLGFLGWRRKRKAQAVA